MIVTNVKRFFLKLFKPIAVWFSRRGNQESLITEEAVEKILELSQPGDILLSYEFGRPTSHFIKGEWDHSAMVNDVKKVVDAVVDKFVDGKNIGGVRLNFMRKWLYNMDGVALIRPITPNPEHNLIASKRCNQFIGLSYDHSFETNDEEEIYCSELPYASYIKAYPSFLWYHKGDEILPQYYYDMCKLKPQHFQLIYEFKGVKQ